MIWAMNGKEIKATVTLAGLFALRMLALFMILPVLQLTSSHYGHASPLMLGAVIGVYGLSQAIFQIPLGALSDKWGRKRIIFFGLGLFVLGSFVAANADSFLGLIIGRGLQGAGAIGSTLLALVADVTREEVRTKSMAIIGMTIGLSFVMAMILGPFIAGNYGLRALFWLTFLLGILGVLWFWWMVPAVESKIYFNKTEGQKFFELLKNPQLMRLNFSILILHAQFATCFLFLPELLLKLTGLANAQMWRIYLPVLVASLVLIAPMLRLADRQNMAKPMLLAGITLFGLSICILGLYPLTKQSLLITLMIFFASFNLLEAQLPAWTSKAAPHFSKGSALGLYSTAQFLGIFLGGIVGGVLQTAAGTTGLVLWCVLLLFLWLVGTLDLVAPQKMVANNNTPIVS